MPTWVAIVILAAYASLLVELTIIRVPSVASSLNIWMRSEALVAAYSESYRRIFWLAQPWKLVLLGIPLLVVYGVYIYPLLTIAVGPNLLGDYLFTPTAIAEGCGVVLIIVGRFLALATALDLRRHGPHDGGRVHLRTSGVFRLSRNPGLVGMYVFCAGLWLTMPSASLLAGILVYGAYMDLKVRMEEDFLRNTLGAPYVAYQLRTGRYIA
jgi:protein-S-isoprenylcysteine O-methyltransferase Ste14